MKRNIIICEYASTGFNYIADVCARGYNPVLLDGILVGTEEEVRPFREMREAIKHHLGDSVPVIPENADYGEVLRQVKAYDPALVIAGSEYGVAIATQLAADLGLPGNPADRIRAMTEKDAMHEALRDHGLRYIRGKTVRTEAEANAWYDELGVEDTVVKRVRGSGTQGLYMCHGRDEMLHAVRENLSAGVKNNGEDVAILIQERITGTEYIVNTVSCNGKHRIVSMWQYSKVRMPNGTNAYDNARSLSRLKVGHSRLVRYACRVADAIGIKYGPVHGEYMVDENGPVLIEVNCRPMGGGLPRKFTEAIFGHHETDAALDSYLDPARFEADALKPYRPEKHGAMKFFILSKDTDVRSAPILQLAQHLPSFYTGSFDRIGRSEILSETRNLETMGGTVYLLHESELQIRRDCALLHLFETEYPEILYQGRKTEAAVTAERNIHAILKKCHGATLVFSDKPDDNMEGAIVTDSAGLPGAYDGYEYGILDLSRPESFADMESTVEEIYAFIGKIRKGGRLLVPASTYCHLPYGIEGMEILLETAGLRIELPSPDHPDLLTASV